MSALGPTFSDQQIPVVADPVQVRAFRKFVPGSGPQPASVREDLTGGRVDDGLDNAAGAARPEARVGEIAGAGLVPREIGVDPDRGRYADRIRPRPAGVVGPDQELAS